MNPETGATLVTFSSVGRTHEHQKGMAGSQQLAKVFEEGQRVPPLRTEVVTWSISVVAIVTSAIVGGAVLRLRWREHQWQSDARRSGHIRVVARIEPISSDVDGDLRSHVYEYVQLTNIGLDIARSVQWKELGDGRKKLDGEASVDLIHPGEPHQMSMRRFWRADNELRIRVEWTDGLGSHEKVSVLGSI